MARVSTTVNRELNFDEKQIPLQQLTNSHPYPIQNMHDINQIYYIYYGSKISGPYTANNIITLYVHKQILSGKKLYISPANGQESWYSLQIPTRSLTQSERVQLQYNSVPYIEEIESGNAIIEYISPVLYKNLVEKVLSGEMKQISGPPMSIPSEAKNIKKRVSLTVTIRRLLGKILLFVMFFVFNLHLLPTIILGVLVGIMMRVCYCCDSYMWPYLSTYFIIFSGLAVTPIVIVYLTIFQLNLYDEIQSFMIAYILWGAVSFMFIYTFILAYFIGFENQKRGDKLMDFSKNIILYIVGVDLGNFDVKRVINAVGHELEWFSSKGIRAMILMMSAPCAALLPAAIGGFIANFILEEKFELRCRADITNNDKCFDSFESSYGCCEIISSHYWKNTYVFMGGLTSNILATWAIIRMSGYLLVHAYPNFSVHASRRIVK